MLRQSAQRSVLQVFREVCPRWFKSGLYAAAGSATPVFWVGAVAVRAWSSGEAAHDHELRNADE